MGILYVTFEIKNICFRDNDNRYTIAKVIIKDYNSGELNKEMIVKGYFPNLFIGDTFKSMALKKEDNSYGYYLNLVDIPELIIPENIDALAEFISRRVRGLSKKKALDIVNVLGLEILSKIKEDYTPLLQVKGISSKKAMSIRNQLIGHESFELLALFIQSISLPVKYAVKIYNLYGEDSLNTIKRNPYSICYNFSISFEVADKIAHFLAYEANNEKRVFSAIANFINSKSERNGDLCVYKTDLMKNLNNYLNEVGVFKNNNITEKEILNGINSLIDTKIIVIDKDKNDNEVIYTNFNNIIENQIVSKLRKFILNNKNSSIFTKDITEFLNDYEKKSLKLDEKQKKAVYMAMENKISILTGGPGTGKTNTTNVILKCISHIKPDAVIKLLAPTGRASQRMTELTSMEASTIHRCLKINPYSSTADIEEIYADYIFIDESSMIDAYVFNKLLSAISDYTKILFVGDVDQLPSVGAGLVFKDLIDSGKIPITKLTTVFRQAEKSLIVKNAHRIIKGLKTTDIDGVDISNDKKSNFKFWNETNPSNIKKKVIMTIDKLMKDYKYKFNEISILSPMKKGDIGTIELNRLIQEKYNPASPSKSEYEIDAITCFREGDRVIQNSNNYDLNVFNGDIGIIRSIYVVVEDGVEVCKMDVEYPTKDITYKESEFEEIELAYSITIHKSQGSEFPAIVIPIHSMFSSMLYRNLIYTGVTRAKEMCIMIGEVSALNNSIKQVNATERISLLKEKIMNI